MQQTPLGGLSAKEFLRRYWQKRPLLVRRALPGFRGVLDRNALFALAARSDVESRLVERAGSRWRVTQGPISGARLARAGKTGWTLLVHGVNHFRAAAERLLRRFAFVPEARLDDLMVSYAVPGGGVGPHFDGYDVFLVQGPGRRVWRLERPRRFALLPGAPLKLIAGFRPEEEFLLEPGDLLYLPPRWGHDGVALDPGFTCSVGFRAPRGAELAAAFLDYLQERGLPDAEYRDPGLRPAARPALVGEALARYARKQLARIRWRAADEEIFLGRFLSAPRADTVFALPRRPLARRAFARRLARGMVALDPRTRLLYRGRQVFINGEALAPRETQRRALAALADGRRLAGRTLARAALGDLLYDWYRGGYLRLERST